VRSLYHTAVNSHYPFSSFGLDSVHVAFALNSLSSFLDQSRMARGLVKTISAIRVIPIIVTFPGAAELPGRQIFSFCEPSRPLR
jgi:hypothetical protein